MTYLAGTDRDVDTGETYFEMISKEGISGSNEGKRKIQRMALRRLPVYGDQPLEAYVNHARWIVDCPNCNNAEFYFEDKLFWCSVCKNSYIQGKTRVVKIPNERKQIEEILGERLIINRHWHPGETIEDLENESKKMGLLK